MQELDARTVLCGGTATPSSALGGNGCGAADATAEAAAVASTLGKTAAECWDCKLFTDEGFGDNGRGRCAARGAGAAEELATVPFEVDSAEAANAKESAGVSRGLAADALEAALFACKSEFKEMDG